MNISDSIDGVWELLRLPAGTAESPEAIPGSAEWIGIPGPMTVAAAYDYLGRRHELEDRSLDDDDWWFRCRFDGQANGGAASLQLDGLATMADIWVNGCHRLHSENMFVGYDIPVTLERGSNRLHMRFHALSPLLDVKRPRGRWRTRLVPRQQLRWHRTALLGRISEWSPQVAPVGPWRGVRLGTSIAPRIHEVSIRSTIVAGSGVVRARLLFGLPAGRHLEQADLKVGGAASRLTLRNRSDGCVEATGEVQLPDVQRWWPHTHGDQALYPVRLALRLESVGVEIPLGKTGFRTLEVDRGSDGQGFGLRVNGVDIFCRGACWTPLDLARLHSDPADYRTALLQARNAGMNMLRVGGTMVYEADAFYDACDELGIMVWQDFMLANMDYPSHDEAFVAAVETEAAQLLVRIAGRPSLAVLCGGSEVEQQASMLGLSTTGTAPDPLIDRLARQSAQAAPEVPWVPSSPTGGTHPFQSNVGVSHYYGVGAYRRPIEDARRAGVRFASECLAFSNVGEPCAGGRPQDPDSPEWKAGVPRDPGSDWDFEQVRDHYLGLLFGLDPANLRAQDPARYAELGALITGEVMERVIGEWRRPGSSCRGALVWFLRDLADGPGWGVVDHAGRPKPAWWHLRRAFAPQALFAGDEGLNGLYYHIVNDSPAALDAELRMAVYRNGRVRIAEGSRTVHVAARGAATFHGDAMLPGFMDLTYAYRFGPPGHDAVAARLVAADGSDLATAWYWPQLLPAGRERDLTLSASARKEGADYVLTLASDHVAFGVSIRAAGFDPEDNWFHLEPGIPRRIRVHAIGAPRPLAGTISALNGAAPVPIMVDD